MNKANSRKKGNKRKQARHAACWARGQAHKALRIQKGGHHQLGTLKSKQPTTGR